MKISVTNCYEKEYNFLICHIYVWIQRRKYLFCSGSTVVVYRSCVPYFIYRTGAYYIPSLPILCYLCSYFLKYLEERQQYRPWSDCSCSWRSNLIWVCTLCIRHFIATLVYEILGHLRYFIFHKTLREIQVNSLQPSVCVILCHIWPLSVGYLHYLTEQRIVQ